MMKSRLLIVTGLLLVLALVLAGCGSQITAEEIVAKMQETVESTQDGHAVVAVEVNAQGIDVSATAEVWEKSPNKFRAVVLEASKPDLVGMTMVSDGQQAWLYSPERNRVMVGSAGEVEMPLPEEMLTEMQDTIQGVLEVSNVELAGEEEIAGREAYKLVLSPKEEAYEKIFVGGGIATLWVDKEQWMILKATYEADAFGQGNMEVQSFELNPGLGDDLFVFEMPEGAEIVEVEPQQIELLTLDEAKAQAEFPLLVPEYVSGGATLIEVFKAGNSFVLRYDHSTQVSFTIMQGSELEGPPPLGDNQDITVRGHDATVITDVAGGNTFLYWTENGVTITVAGHISLDEALKVAESLK
jgi:outer membrane lipoprotein-sorting protein